MLLAGCLASFLIILILRFIFPLISGLISAQTGFAPENYYSLVAITFISIIPLLIGMVSAFNHQGKNDMHERQSGANIHLEKRNILYMRMLVSAGLSFVLVYITIVLTHPVPAQGWLRSLFAAFLLSVQAPFVFLFIKSAGEKKIAGLSLSGFFWIFLIALPSGLLLHHPWNYLAFFSPLYWTAWAWLIGSPAESFIYGSIALILTAGFSILFLLNHLKKQTT